MKIKTIIISVLSGLLMFGLNFAQTNVTRPYNSNSAGNANQQILSDNSNTSTTLRANQEREKESLSEVACQYLTKADAKLILQSEVYGNGALTSHVDKNYFCNYSALGKSDTKRVSVRLDIKVFATKTEADKEIAEKIEAARLIKSKTLNSGIGNTQTLTGIGDSAELIIIGNDSVHLYFRKDITVFELSVSNLKYKKLTLKNLKLLAKKVAENFSVTKTEQK